MNQAVEVGDCHASLLHAVAMAQSDGVVLKRLMIDGDAEGGANGVLTAVAFSDGVFFVVAGGEVKFEVVE